MKTLKIALTGRLRSGKDHTASQFPALHLLGFADPFYEISTRLFGVGAEGKDLVPGLRKLYQQIGQWGRGFISSEYPLTAERAVFTAVIREQGASLVDPESKWKIDWRSYGRNPDIWLNALIERSKTIESGLVIVTNVRFENELKTVTASGFEHYHVTCSPVTYNERLTKAGIKPGDPRLSDESERLARDLDARVISTCRENPGGSRLKVIWNDHRPTISPRLMTLEHFVKHVNKQLDDLTRSNPDQPQRNEASGPSNRANDFPDGSPERRVEANRDRDPRKGRRAGGNIEETPAPA